MVPIAPRENTESGQDLYTDHGREEPNDHGFALSLNVRFATRAKGGQFIVATSSDSMSMVVPPLLTSKHPRESYLYMCSHSITSLVVKYLG